MSSPVPINEAELLLWLSNFSKKLPNYLPTLLLPPAEIEESLGDVEYLMYLLKDLLPTGRRTLAATVEFKNLIKNGEASEKLPETLPWVTPAPQFSGVPPKPGVMGRLRKLVQNIKTRPGYTETIGQDLNIVTGEADSGGGATVPTLTLISTSAGAVTLGWNKSGWTGVKIQSRSSGAGGGAAAAMVWQDLGIDLYSPFVDTRPLTVAGQPESREYRACYLDGDTPQADWSQALTLTVTP